MNQFSVLAASLAPMSGDMASGAKALQDDAALRVRSAQGPAPSEAFADHLWNLVQRVDGRDQAAGERMAAVERGESDDLVGAMLASQEASLSFSMLMQVRNKVVGAVDELIKLQL